MMLQISSILRSLRIARCGIPSKAKRCISSLLPSVSEKPNQTVSGCVGERLKVGDKLHGYLVIQVSEVPEFFAVAALLRHEKTGAEHLHVARDDQNNVFSVAFRTTPMDSTGVPHILEHTVLCGSRNYPVRDPFFKMLNRSLATFMNAFTASDWTMYPFSTQNSTDYKNLMSVYLDAAFFPNLKEADFRQEGWRLEPANLNDPNSEVIFKGVVFNEMKGALSTAESIYQTQHQCLLLPSHTYGYVSGGDPVQIPLLTWDKLKSFHASHYHPSNARFYTYGSFPLAEHLEKINNYILQNFDRIDPGTEVPPEQRWDKERVKSITCPMDALAPDPSKQTMVSVSYMVDCVKDPFEQFTLGILSALLVSGPNSPFYQALIEANIGSDYTPVCGIETSTKNPTFAVGLQGIREEDVDRVVGIIDSTFKKIATEGFDKERIESILHRVELAQKHQTSNFGLGLIMAVIPHWNHGCNPIDLLHINEHVENFKKELTENPSFLVNKVKEYFLSNTHRLKLVMTPDPDYAAKKLQEEQALLKEKLSLLSPEETSNLFESGKELERLQSLSEDISVLPMMKVADIDRKLKRTVSEQFALEGVNVQTCKEPTNGITYFRSIVTTSTIPYVLKPYLPLFCNVLTKLGAGGMDHRVLAQQVELFTGGLGVGPHMSPDHTDPVQFELGVEFSSYCLDRNVPNMLSLWQDVFNEPMFNNAERLKTLINVQANDLAMSVADSGHAYAMATAAASLTPSARTGELFGGMSQVRFMKEVAELENLDDVIQNLMKIAAYLLNANEMRCALNASEEALPAALMGLQGWLLGLQTVGFEDHDHVGDPTFQAKQRKTLVEMDFPVNYVSRCVRTVPYTHPDNAKLQILAKLMSSKHLHREIREKGGAYGAGAKCGGGLFSFFSYRDPNTLKTLDAFERSSVWAAEGKFSDQDIDEAKLAVFAAVDSPVAPSGKGMILFRDRVSDDMRQTHRDQLFAVDRHQLVDVARRYLIPGTQVDSLAIVGPKNDQLDESWKRR